MTQELQTENYIDSQLKEFNISDNAIEELRNKYLPLKIESFEDKKGYQVVKAARIVVKSYRVDIEKKRKELVENPLKIQRAINAEAKRVTQKLEEIENYLSKQEDEFDQEIQRKQKEAEAIIEERYLSRVKMLRDIWFSFDGTVWQAIYEIDPTDMFSAPQMTCSMLPLDIREMSDETFAIYYVNFRKAYDAHATYKKKQEAEKQAEWEAKETARKIAEELNRIEREKLQAEREEQAKIQLENEELRLELLSKSQKIDERLLSKNIDLRTDLLERKPAFSTVVEGFVPLEAWKNPESLTAVVYETLTPYGILVKFVKEISQGDNSHALRARDILSQIGELHEELRQTDQVGTSSES